MSQTTKRSYWRKTLRVTAALLFVWFAVTFVAGYYARELSILTLFGFPLGFYMGAQGALLVYLAIVGVYAIYMNRLGDEYGVGEEATIERGGSMTIVVLQLIGILRALVEVAGMALLAQGTLFVLCAGGHRDNLVYRFFAVVARPAIVATRRIVPQAIGERRISLLAFVLLFLLWIVLAYVRLALQG